MPLPVPLLFGRTKDGGEVGGVWGGVLCDWGVVRDEGLLTEAGEIDGEETVATASNGELLDGEVEKDGEHEGEEVLLSDGGETIGEHFGEHFPPIALPLSLSIGMTGCIAVPTSGK